LRKFYRSKDDQKIAGICGALGEMFTVDANLVRIGLVFLALLTHIFPATVAYIIAWIILPESQPED